MPTASLRSSMSLAELAVCEDFLDSNREYARDLFSSLHHLSQLHPTKSCLGTREGHSCSICELCSADGLVGATKRALETYGVAEKRLKAVRASLGMSLISHVTRSRETLLRNSVAKTVFFSVVTTGDALRSQHTTWQTRLRTEVAKSPERCPSDFDTNEMRDILHPTYSVPRVVGPERNAKLAAASAGSVSEPTSTSSMFVVFRRCLTPDCPCELNQTNSAVNAQTSGSRAASTDSPVLVPPKARTYMRSEKANDVSEAVTKAEANSSTQESSTCHDSNNPLARGSDTLAPQDTVLAMPATSKPAVEASQEPESSSSSPDSSASIMDPRVSRLSTQIIRSDDARRALMKWCRTCVAVLQLDSRKARSIGPETSPTHARTAKDRHGYPIALTLDVASTEAGKPLGDVREATTKGLARGDEETTAQDLRFDEQEELARRWLTARQKRCKDTTRRPSRYGRDPH